MFKIIIPIPEEKRAVQVSKDLPVLVGMQIGDKFDGSMLGLTGYTLQITGGSDKEGFPMRKDMPGTGRKRTLLAGGLGCKYKGKGIRVKKSIRGNRIGEDIAQINVKIAEKKSDAKPVWDLLGLNRDEIVKKSEEKKKQKSQKKIKNS